MSEPTENIVVNMSAVPTASLSQTKSVPKPEPEQETIECNVCYEKYNKTVHTKILCEFGDCNYDVCKTCVRTYLLGTTALPNCMKCNKVWSETFIVEKLNVSFIKNEYKEHRKELLLQHQISRLPESMGDIERYKEIKKEEENYEKIKQEILDLRLKDQELRNALHLKSNVIHTLKTGRGVVKEDKRQFIMACVNNDCRGYLSIQYKCNVCELFTCSKCFEIVGHTKHDPHTCKEENVQSADLIRKETKPCPKCGTRISKISGCDQMWCTECHVAFGWNTGRIDNGIVHNPEFYRYMRANNSEGAPPRNPGDVICGGMPGYYDLKKFILDKIKFTTQSKENTDKEMTLKEKIRSIHRNLAHISQHEIYNHREAITRLNNFEKERIQYLINDITKITFAAKIYSNDTKRKKETEIMHIYELIVTVTNDLFRMLTQSKNIKDVFIDEVKMCVTELKTLSEYCNTQLKKISSTYSMVTPHFTSTFTINMKKFSVKGNEIVTKKKQENV